MQKGVLLNNLLASRVFNWTFDFDNWPGTHNDDRECIRPFNGSFFDIRDSYETIFPDILPMQDQEKNLEGLGLVTKQKIFKIKYSINLLA